MEYHGSFLYEPDVAEYTANVCTGTVFKTQEELGETTYVGFNIPKLMPFVDASEGPKEGSVSIKKTIFANSSDLSSVPETIKTLNYIKVKYNGRSNFSQPLIALGESAQIFFENNDYKHPLYTDAHNNEIKRKTDILKIYVQAKDKGDDEGEDWYYVLLDSVNKKINIHSSNKNGETHTYDFLIDADNSKVTLTDDKENQIMLSSEDKEILLKNQSNTSIDMKDKDITCTCDGDYSISCKNFKVSANSSISEEAKTKYESSAPKVSISGKSTIECTTAMMNCNVSAKFACTAPLSMFSGVAAAVTLAVNAGGAPSPQAISSAMAQLSSVPTDTAAQGIKTVSAILALVPFTTLPPVAAGVVSGLAAQIPKPTVMI